MALGQSSFKLLPLVSNLKVCDLCESMNHDHQADCIDSHRKPKYVKPQRSSFELHQKSCEVCTDIGKNGDKLQVNLLFADRVLVCFATLQRQERPAHKNQARDWWYIDGEGNKPITFVHNAKVIFRAPVDIAN